MKNQRFDVISRALHKLMDDVSLPTTGSDKNFVSRIEWLRGAVWYALEVGDIDKGQYRIFMDRLADLYEIATTLKPLT